MPGDHIYVEAQEMFLLPGVLPQISLATILVFIVSLLGCVQTKGFSGEEPNGLATNTFLYHPMVDLKPGANFPHRDLDRTIWGKMGKEVMDDAMYLATSPFRIDAKSALIIGGVAGGIGGLMLADSEIQEKIQRNRGNPGNSIADALEIAGSPEVIFAGQVGLLAAGFWFREDETGDTLLRTTLISLEAQLFTEATAGFLKIAVGRRRPNAQQGAHTYTSFQSLDFDRSFPSSHAARAFAVAAVFADRYPQPVPFLAYTLASLIGVSRVFQDEHFASDILAGGALGWAIGKALSWRHEWPNQRLTVLPIIAGNTRGVGLSIWSTF